MKKLLDRIIANIPLALTLIIALSFGLRIARCCLSDRIDKDSVLYISMARDWANKDIDSAFDKNPRIPPLYIAIMAVGEKAGLGAENTGRITSVVAGSILPLAVFMIAIRIMSAPLALLAALICAVEPSLIRISEDIIRDSLFICLTTFALAFIIQASDMRWRSLAYWAAGGILTALAIMTRSEGIEILIIAAVWLCVEFAVAKEKTLKAFRVPVLGFFIASLLFLATGISAQLYLEKSTSTWTLVDSRIYGYINSLLYMKDKSIKEKEEKYSR